MLKFLLGKWDSYSTFLFQKFSEFPMHFKMISYYDIFHKMTPDLNTNWNGNAYICNFCCWCMIHMYVTISTFTSVFPSFQMYGKKNMGLAKTWPIHLSDLFTLFQRRNISYLNSNQDAYLRNTNTKSPLYTYIE